MFFYFIFPIWLPMALSASLFCFSVHTVGQGRLGVAAGLALAGMACGGVAAKNAERARLAGCFLSPMTKDSLAFLVLSSMGATWPQFSRSWSSVPSGWGYAVLVWAAICWLMLILIPFKFATRH